MPFPDLRTDAEPAARVRAFLGAAPARGERRRDGDDRHAHAAMTVARDASGLVGR